MRMKRYIGVKLVLAQEMDADMAGQVLDRPIDTTNSPDGKGYLVEYEDRFQSWCPKAQFEKANRPVDGMSFGLAIEAAKKGFKVARKGWNGKDMFVVMQDQLNLAPYSQQDAKLKVNDRTARFIGKDTPLRVVPYFCMKAANGDWVPGWLASQTDMLADDWMIVE